MNDLFIPNRNISKDAMRYLIGFQIVFAFLLWMFSPFVYLPRPGETFSALADLWQDGLGGELIVSLTLNLEALLVATVLSLLLAYSSRLPFMRPVVVLVGKLRFLSMAGLTFLFTMLARNGQELKVYLLVFSVSVFFVTGMADVIASIPQEQYDLARTLRMNEWQVLLEVVMFGQADRGFDTMRQNAAIGWLMLTMVEGMARSGGGIGTVLLDQNRHFHLSAVFAIQLVILGCGLIQDYSIGLLRIWFCPYADLSLEKK
jgi:NitT/TauT family transport system permease protein